MPYRRLPNTDQARVRALQIAVEASLEKTHKQLVISYKLEHEAKITLNKFERMLGLYKQMYDNQVNSNKDFQQVFRNARMYISHFIQVLNLSVIRGEIKPEHKEYYRLDADNFSVPEMATADAVLECGKNIIEGEALRIKNGGAPIYNPSIAKVQVHYDIFKEHRSSQLLLQQNTVRYAEHVNAMRESVDAIILEMWNQIEGCFSNLPPCQRLQACQQFGVIYYYRRGEKELTPEDDAGYEEIVAKKTVETEASISQNFLIPTFQSGEEGHDAELLEEPKEITSAPVAAIDTAEEIEPFEYVENESIEDNSPFTDMPEYAHNHLFNHVASEENEDEQEDMSMPYEKETVMNELALDIDMPTEVKIVQTTARKQKKHHSKHGALLSLFFQ